MQFLQPSIIIEMQNTESLKQIYGKRFYGFFRFVVKIYNAFVLHAKIRRNYKTDKPYLMLINHQSYYDFFYVVRLAGKDYVNFVVADKMSNTKRNRWFIKNLKAITRGQFSSDFTSIKKIKATLDAGICVAMFPEGKITADGVTGKITKSTGKLVKWLGYPVVAANIRGAYSQNPVWNPALHYHKKSEIEGRLLFSEEDIKRLSVAEINAAIEQALYVNDNVYTAENRISRGASRADGLEKLLYTCPFCNSEYELSASKGKLTCGKCGATFEYTSDGLIAGAGEYDRIDKLYGLQKEIAAKRADESYCLLERAVCSVFDKELPGYRNPGEGTLLLNRDGIRYTGTIDGSRGELFFELKNLPAIPFAAGRLIDIYKDGKNYRFGFDKSTRFVLAAEAMFDKFCAQSAE